MVEKMPLQCSRMAIVAAEYCRFIDNFNGRDRAIDRRINWLHRLEKLLPRLHVAVIALTESTENAQAYWLHDDDKRCELFLRLDVILQSDERLWAAYEVNSHRQQSRQALCERMADNLTDMYFDLKRGLELMRESPEKAASNWQSSFYAHWGKHLLDAECWLHAVDAGGEPPHLPEWQWPNTPALAIRLA